MARFFIAFLLLSIVSTLKAAEHQGNNIPVGEGNKKDHQAVRHEEGVVKKEELHGHRNEGEGIKHEEHAGKKEEHHGGGREGEVVEKKHHEGGKEGEGVKKTEHHREEHAGKKEEHHGEGKEGEGVKKDNHEGGIEGEGIKKEHHGGEKEGEGVEKGEHHEGRKEGESVKKEHHEGGKEGEGVKEKEHHREENGGEGIKKEHNGEEKEAEGVKKEHHEGRKEGEGFGHQQPYRDRFEPRQNRTNRWSFFTPDEQEEKVKAARINNVIVNGVPEKDNEDMKETVEEIGQKLGFEYPLDDVDTAYRLICTKVPRPIIIRLVDMHIKAQWIIAYRRSRLWRERIYMEEHLTKNTQKLSHATRIWATKQGYPHVWTWHGEVFYRKRDNPMRFKILNMDHLNKLHDNEQEHEVTDTPPRY